MKNCVQCTGFFRGQLEALADVTWNTPAGFLQLRALFCQLNQDDPFIFF